MYQLRKRRMNMNTVIYFVQVPPGLHGVNHFLNKYRGMGPDDMKTQYLSAISGHDSLGKALPLHHGFALGNVRIPSLTHNDIMMSPGLLLSKPHTAI